MKLHYGGRYRTDDDLKSKREHHPNAVPFKEPTKNRFTLIANALSIVTMVILSYALYKRIGGLPSSTQVFWGLVISLLTALPHELLHALCFREDVYIYHMALRLILFVHGTESMSKERFIFLSLLPNVIFGFIPYIIFMIDPSLEWLGVMGAMCIGMGFGDFINVFNAATQMPKGSMTYLSGFHSFWYVEDGNRNTEDGQPAPEGKS